MTQTEKLLARIKQAISQSGTGIMTIQVPIVNGVPVFWVIQAPTGAEGAMKILDGAGDDGLQAMNGI